MFLLKDTAQWHQWGLNPQPLVSTTEPLRSHIHVEMGLPELNQY